MSETRGVRIALRKQWRPQIKEDKIEDLLEKYDYEINEDLTYFEALKKAETSSRIQSEGITAELGPWQREEQIAAILNTHYNDTKPALNISRQISPPQSHQLLLNQVPLANKITKPTSNTPVNQLTPIKTELWSKDFDNNLPVSSKTAIARPSSSDAKKIRRPFEPNFQTTTMRLEQEKLLQENIKDFFPQTFPLVPSRQASEKLFNRSNLVRETMKIKHNLKRKLRFVHKRMKRMQKQTSDQHLDPLNIKQVISPHNGKFINITRLLTDDRSYDTDEENENIPQFENAVIKSRITSPEALNKSSFHWMPETKNSLSIKISTHYSTSAENNFNATLFGNRLLAKKSQVNSSTQKLNSGTDYYGGLLTSVLSNTNSFGEDASVLKIHGTHQSLGDKPPDSSKLKKLMTFAPATDSTIRLFGQQPYMKEASSLTLNNFYKPMIAAAKEKDHEKVGKKAGLQVTDTKPHRKLRSSDFQDKEAIKDTMKILKRINYNTLSKKSGSVEGLNTQSSIKNLRKNAKSPDINLLQSLSSQRPILFTQTSKTKPDKLAIEDRKSEFIDSFIQKLEPKIARESYSSNTLNSNVKLDSNEAFSGQQIANPVLRYSSSGKIIIHQAPSYVSSNKQ